ncbi:MAG: hypothetical protein R2695_00730 [Acidimicrobiales bacterium]
MDLSSEPAPAASPDDVEHLLITRLAERTQAATSGALVLTVLLALNALAEYRLSVVLVFVVVRLAAVGSNWLVSGHVAAVGDRGSARDQLTAMYTVLLVIGASYGVASLLFTPDGPFTEHTWIMGLALVGVTTVMVEATAFVRFGPAMFALGVWIPVLGRMAERRDGPVVASVVVFLAVIVVYGSRVHRAAVAKRDHLRHEPAPAGPAVGHERPSRGGAAGVGGACSHRRPHRPLNRQAFTRGCTSAAAAVVNPAVSC